MPCSFPSAHDINTEAGARMAATMFLSAITLKNILSLREVSLELCPLNVLIGPNASGKSNFVEAVSLLRAAPADLQKAFLHGGGIREGLWKGGKVASPIATLECRVAPRDLPPAVYMREFSESVEGFVVLREWLKEAAGQSKR